MNRNEIAAKKRKERKTKQMLSFKPCLIAFFAPFAPFRGWTLMFWMFLAAQAGWAGPMEMPRQTITLPDNAGAPYFVDIAGRGLCDLLVMDQAEHRLFIYHQRPAGFSKTPDQIIPMPPQTAWAAVCDVDAHPGLELLMSTAGGLVYSRQNGGLFESERRTLIPASQVFTNDGFPMLYALSTNIPVISADRIVLYHRNSQYDWSPEPPLPLEVKGTRWRAYDDGQWMMGANPAHSLRFDRWFQTKRSSERSKEPEDAAIQKIMDDMKKNNQGNQLRAQRVDVDGDGREDLVLWQVTGAGLGLKTDVYIFLRGPDQQLPGRPSQILHCRGLGIPLPGWLSSPPLHDLKGDGRWELVLLEIKPGMTSVGGLVEAALSRGLDCLLTIRAWHQSAFSSSPDASMPVKIILADWDQMDSSSLDILGDFNGDGRPDLLVRRSETQWNIFLSTHDGRWFEPQPALTFEAPARGYPDDIKDLNGDGLADIIWSEPDDHRLTIFMSPLRPTKGKQP
jgi:hypothetical protein